MRSFAALCILARSGIVISWISACHGDGKPQQCSKRTLDYASLHSTDEAMDQTEGVNMKSILLLIALIVLSSCSSGATPATPVLAGEDRLRQDGIDYLMQFVTKCGEDYYLGKETFRGGLDVLQGKKINFTFGPGYIAPRPLTDADRLNKVTPAPAGWNGLVDLNFIPGRSGKQNQLGSKNIERWIDIKRLSLRLMFENGKWSTEYDRFVAIDCSTASTLFEP